MIAPLVIANILSDKGTLHIEIFIVKEIWSLVNFVFALLLQTLYPQLLLSKDISWKPLAKFELKKKKELENHKLEEFVSLIKRYLQALM